MLDALTGYNLSAIEFYCSQEDAEKAMEQLQKSFNYRWRRALPQMARAHHCHWDSDTREFMYEYNPVPLETELTEYGFCATIWTMDIWVGEDNGMPDWIPLFRSLDTFRRKFPRISYRGYVGYMFSDHLGGQAEQYEFFSDALKNERFYESIKRSLQKAVLDAQFWEILFNSTRSQDVDEVISTLKLYEEWFDDGYKALALKAAESDKKAVLTKNINKILNNRKNSKIDTREDQCNEQINDKDEYLLLPTKLTSLIYLAEKMKKYGEIEHCIEAGISPEVLVREWAKDGQKEAENMISLLDGFKGKVIWDKKGNLLIHPEFCKSWITYKESIKEKGKQKKRRRKKV